MADTTQIEPPIQDATLQQNAGDQQAILDRLVEIRKQLQTLKQDKSTYIKSSDVMALYKQTVNQIRLLQDLHSHEAHVDKVVDDCLHLLSLFFMTIGRNNEAPAVYALSDIIKRLLLHLAEAVLYSAKDLDHIADTLINLRDIVKNAESKNEPNFLTLRLSNRLELCHTSCHELQQSLNRLDPSLQVLHEKLISILRLISLANTKTNFSSTEVKKYQEQLREVDTQRGADGNFVDAEGNIPAGNEEVGELLRRCLLWSEMVLERKGQMPEQFSKTYETLVDIRNKLEKKTLTQAWSLRETDLYDYQRQLDEIDVSRVDGNFHDKDGNPAELYVQRTFLYLIRRCYGYIYFLMVSSEPVSEALLPVYNQLLTLRRCLHEVKASGGVSSPRELYPYSMKLNSIDNMRKDGKFMVGDDIPEGQGSVNELLSQCFELQYELKVAAEEAKEEPED